MSKPEGGDDWCVIGWPFGAARFKVDSGCGAAGSERIARQHQVNAQAVVAAEGAGAVIPPREQPAGVVVLAEDVDEAEAFIAGLLPRVYAADGVDGVKIASTPAAKTSA